MFRGNKYEYKRKSDNDMLDALKLLLESRVLDKKYENSKLRSRRESFVDEGKDLEKPHYRFLCKFFNNVTLQSKGVEPT